MLTQTYRDYKAVELHAALAGVYDVDVSQRAYTANVHGDQDAINACAKELRKRAKLPTKLPKLSKEKLAQAVKALRKFERKAAREFQAPKMRLVKVTKTHAHFKAVK